MMKQSFCSFSCLGQQKFPEPTDPLQRVTFTRGTKMSCSPTLLWQTYKFISKYVINFSAQLHLKALSDSQVIELLA